MTSADENTPYTRAEVLASVLATPNATCREHLEQLRRLRDRPFDAEAADLHEALVWVTSYRLPAKGGALQRGTSAAAPLPAKLPEQLLQLLEDVEPDVPIDIRARIHDTLWEARRSSDAAAAAPRAYLKAAHALAATAPAVLIARRVDRAFGITRMRRADEAELRRLALDFVRTEAHAAPCRVLVAAVLAERRVNELQDAIDAIEPLVQATTPNNAPPGTIDWEWSRRAWEVLAQLYANAGDSTKRDTALRSRAITFTQQARMLDVQGAKAMMVADRLERGIRELLRLGHRDEAESLKPDLASAQRRQHDEMVNLSSGSIDLTEEANRARKAVTQPTWREALLALVGLVTPRNIDELRQQAEENRQKHPLLFLIGRQTLDRHGRTAATDDDDDTLTADMVDNVTFSARLNAAGVINPARQQILADHNPGLDEWADLLREGLAPHDRLESWAKAFDAGLRGDWLVSLHLLIPQLENFVREALEANGHVPTNFHEGGVEISNAFGGLLEHPALPKILPPDLLFELKALLVARGGLNLRNLLAHGQLPDGIYHSENCAYVWHLGLRLTLVGVLNMEHAKEEQSPVDGSPSP